MEIFYKLWKCLKKMFTSKGSTTVKGEFELNKTQNTKKNIAKKGGVIFDNSQNINQPYTEQNKLQTNRNEKNLNFGLIIKARWLGNVPYELVQTQGFDKFLVLTPTENDYIKPRQMIYVGEKLQEEEIRNQPISQKDVIYFLIEAQSSNVLYNLSLNKILIEMDSGVKYSSENGMPIIATITKDYAFSVCIPNLTPAKGKIFVEFLFENSAQKLKQRFELETYNDSTLFLEKKYYLPEEIAIGEGAK